MRVAGDFLIGNDARLSAFSVMPLRLALVRGTLERNASSTGAECALPVAQASVRSSPNTELRFNNVLSVQQQWFACEANRTAPHGVARLGNPTGEVS